MPLTFPDPSKDWPHKVRAVASFEAEATLLSRKANSRHEVLFVVDQPPPRANHLFVLKLPYIWLALE